MVVTTKALRAALAVAFMASGVGIAQAQAPDPKGCTPQERRNRALSQDANNNAGVICPPDIDPAMKAPTPKTGDPSVIPPVGATQPK